MGEEPLPSSHVAVVGSINLDIVAEVPHLPRAGETVIARTVRRNVGGKGANQAVAARLGDTPVEFLGRIGDDDHGVVLRDGLESMEVGTRGLRTTAGESSGAAYICVSDDDNTIVVEAGANWHWGEPHAFDEEVVRDAVVVVCQMEVPDAVLHWAAGTAAGRFILNAAPARDVPHEVLVRCDPLVVNEQELAAVSGRAVNDLESASAAQEIVLQQGARSVVTTLGPLGAVYSSADGPRLQPTLPARVRDTTGAGDAFVGVLAARLAGGADLPAAVAWAAAAASLSVESPGTHDAYPNLRRTEVAVERLPAHRAIDDLKETPS